MPPQDTKIQENNEESPLKTLRTFQGDMENTIHNKNESKISIAVAEFKEEEKKESGDSKKTLTEFKEGKSESIFLTYGLLPLLGLLFIVIGGGLVFGVYYYTKKDSTPINIVTNQTLIPYTSKHSSLLLQNIEANSVANIITNQLKTLNKPLGSILYIEFLQPKNVGEQLVNNPLATIDLFKNIAPSASKVLGRSLGETYMLGIYVSDKNSPFILLSSEDYGQTFAGMLAWETTIQDDMFNIFPNLTKKGFASTNSIWQDETLSNRNMRVLKDENGNTVLVYGFFDKNILGITSNEKIFLNLANKYTNNKLVH